MIKRYDETISLLKSKGLLTEADKYVFCRYDQPFNVLDMLSAFGGVATVRWSNFDYILAADEERLKIFNINKKTGEFTGNYIFLEKKQINKIKVKKYLFKNIRIIVRAKSIKFKSNYFTKNLFRGYEQTENKNAFVNLLQTNYIGKVGKNYL